ncbi:MAG: response regulator [bacterium]|nr:response regulator [bacterium]
MSLKGKKILVVEDDMILQKTYKEWFTEEGADVISAENGKEGLEKLAGANDIDLIILDIMMHEMTGTEMLEVLNKDDRWKSIPVIVLTNLSEDQDEIHRTLKLGAKDYLIKSNTSLKDLTVKIVNILK